MTKAVAKTTNKPAAVKKTVKMAKGGAVKKLAFGGLNDRNMPSRTPVAPKPVLTQEQAAAQQAKKAALEQQRLVRRQQYAARMAASRTGAPMPQSTPMANPQQATQGPLPTNIGQQSTGLATVQPTQDQSLALQKAYTEAQQIKPMTQIPEETPKLPTAPQMAKGGLVKKKSSMKGIINRFIK